MHVTAPLGADAPDWVLAEMPPGYQTRVTEIQRLSTELQHMHGFGRLLWAVGRDLEEAVRDAFTALKFDVSVVEASTKSAVAVQIDSERRLLLYASTAEGTIDKKSPEVGHVFNVLHQVASEHDRVILVTNGNRMSPPAERPESIAPAAVTLLQRMGVNSVTAPTLFRMWMLAVQDIEGARRFAVRMHEQDGGTFDLPPK
jgi:hypothetical protein